MNFRLWLSKLPTSSTNKSSIMPAPKSRICLIPLNDILSSFTTLTESENLILKFLCVLWFILFYLSQSFSWLHVDNSPVINENTIFVHFSVQTLYLWHIFKKLSNIKWHPKSSLSSGNLWLSINSLGTSSPGPTNIKANTSPNATKE